ncbi:MAG TPA: hypothetical protein VLR29_00170 [Flavobacterium sp.]|nr:hypothetical protein [Flavobacterium sp.]
MKNMKTPPKTSVMQSCTTLIFLSAMLIGCQGKENRLPQTTIKEIALDTVRRVEESKMKITDSAASITKNTHALLLTSNALQLIDVKTGSTVAIPCGTPIDRMVAITNTALQSKPTTIGINNECGAGPLKMTSWSNGLTLVFQQKESDRADLKTGWKFAGWYMGIGSGSAPKVSTMAGISVGSTRAEMESAYVIAVSKTSLGYEFSTSSGLYGIFDGPEMEAEITSLWSGLSCNFR